MRRWFTRYPPAQGRHWLRPRWYVQDIGRLTLGSPYGPIRLLTADEVEACGPEPEPTEYPEPTRLQRVGEWGERKVDDLYWWYTMRFGRRVQADAQH